MFLRALPQHDDLRGERQSGQAAKKLVRQRDPKIRASFRSAARLGQQASQVFAGGFQLGLVRSVEDSFEAVLPGSSGGPIVLRP